MKYTPILKEKLRLGLVGVLVGLWMLSAAACAKRPSGEVLVIYVDSTPYLEQKERNKYYYSEYPASEFFTRAYFFSFINTLNEYSTETGITISMLDETHLPMLQSVLAGHEDMLNVLTTATHSRHYRYLTNNVLAFKDFSSEQQNRLFRAIGTQAGERYTYFMAVDLAYSVVDQRVKKRITLFDRTGAKIFTRKKVLRSKYILYDETSPYLITDSYFNKTFTSRTALAELEYMASHLGSMMGAKIVKKFNRSFQ